MIYMEIIISLVVLLIIFSIVSITIPNQSQLLQESIRQEKAQFIAQNIFWRQIVDGQLVPFEPSNKLSNSNKSSIQYNIEIDGQKYIVTIIFEKINRDK